MTFAPEVPAGFDAPDDDAPLDVEAVRAAVPAGATVKGLFFQDLQKRLTAGGHPPYEGHFVSFKDYPLVVFIDAIAEHAPVLYPRPTLRGAIRAFGESAYPAFADTMIGRMLFGVLGNDVQRMMGAASKAYDHSVNPGKVTRVRQTERSALMQLENIWIFPTCYQVGVFEGGVHATGKEADVRLRTIGPGRVDLFVRWR
jgi:uncharacterized protein (TIGR02265 family)